MKEIFKKLIGSLDNKKDSGFSGRKLTALTLMACIVSMHFVWGQNNDYTENILIIDLIGVAFFLGLVTADQIIKFKSDKNEQDKGVSKE